MEWQWPKVMEGRTEAPWKYWQAILWTKQYCESDRFPAANVSPVLRTLTPHEKSDRKWNSTRSNMLFAEQENNKMLGTLIVNVKIRAAAHYSVSTTCTPRTTTVVTWNAMFINMLTVSKICYQNVLQTVWLTRQMPTVSCLKNYLATSKPLFMSPHITQYNILHSLF